jgi:hypothetical protein
MPQRECKVRVASTVPYSPCVHYPPPLYSLPLIVYLTMSTTFTQPFADAPHFVAYSHAQELTLVYLSQGHSVYLWSLIGCTGKSFVVDRYKQLTRSNLLVFRGELPACWPESQCVVESNHPPPASLPKHWKAVHFSDARHNSS